MNFIEDWQPAFEQEEPYAQPFTTGDIIKVQALSTAGAGETAFLKITNLCTGEEKEVICFNTGIKSGEYWIVEYELPLTGWDEGVYQVYMIDDIDGDIYGVADVNHNGNSCMLFKIISDEAAKDTVKLVYTDRENNFDTVFNDNKKKQDKIEKNERWSSNLIMGGHHYAAHITDISHIPIITPNVANDTEALLGWSRDVVKGNVFVGVNYYEQASMDGIAFVVQYDEMRFYNSSNNEIIVPEGANAGTLTLGISCKAGGQYFDDSVVGDLITGSPHLYPIFIPPTKTISGVQYPVTYTDKYGAGASGWFFGLSVALSGEAIENASKIVFANLLITVITAAEYYEIINEPSHLAWSPALEEMPPESIYFNFRVEGGFLPSERSFAAESGDFRDQRYTPSQLSGHPRQKKTLCAGTREGVPYWVGKKLNQLFSCSFVEINGIEHVRSQNAEPKINAVADLYPLIEYKID
jgi:hypothetical protein